MKCSTGKREGTRRCDSETALAVSCMYRFVRTVPSRRQREYSTRARPWPTVPMYYLRQTARAVNLKVLTADTEENRHTLLFLSLSKAETRISGGGSLK